MPGPFSSATVRALKHRNFRLFFAGQLISLIGTWMQNVAQSWLVYRMTGSSALLGLASFASQIPVFLMSPIGGYAADRWNRRTIVIMTQTASMILALVLSALVLTGRVQVWHIFVLASVLGFVNAFDIPARQAFLVEMVGREDLINAIALNSSMFNGARIIGPAIAGILVAQIGEGWCFFVNGVSYIAVIVGLFMMRLSRFRPKLASMSAWHTIREGFHYVGHTRPIRVFLVLVGVLSFAGLPYAVLMPIFADKILRVGPGGLGILMGVGGLGALAGALLLASRTNLRGLTRSVAAAMGTFSIAIAGFALSDKMWLSCTMLFISGFSAMIQMGASNTLIQSMVPDELRGRVMSVYSMMFMGLSPFGGMFAGFAADRVGAPLTFAAGAGLCLVASGFFAWRLPGIRTVTRDLILAQQATAGHPSEQTTATGAEASMEPAAQAASGLRA